MTITLSNISKRYNYEWIFNNLSYTFLSNHSYAITGANGSGKSTLLKILSGSLTASSGKISYAENGIEIKSENIFAHVSYCAPYLELINEFSLSESIKFHFKFKKPIHDLTETQIIKLSGLEMHKNKRLKNFSSGMKQRVKLLLAFTTDSNILLLDEPTTNLDAQAVDWYFELCKRFCKDRIVIVGSNIEREYLFCEETIILNQYKDSLPKSSNLA